MAASVFAKLKAEKLAQRLGNQSEDHSAETDNPVLAGLLNDFRVDLKHAQSLESKSAKSEFKAERLDHYRSWVTGILDNELMPYDKITTEMAVWSVDGGDIDFSIEIARYMINGQHDLPITFTEKTPTALLRLFTDKADKEPELVSLEHLQKLEEIFADADVKDTVRAKLYRYIAERQVENSPAEALANFEKAKELNPSETVVTVIKNLKKQLEKNSES